MVLMKEIIRASPDWRLFIFVVAILGWTCPDAGATTRVFLLAGQSNMVGLGTSSELTPPLSNPQNDVNIWNNNSWEAPRPGFWFGPEVSFGRTMADALPDDDIYLIKHGASGTNLAVQWAPPTGPEYVAFRNKVDAALTNLENASIDHEISGMLWMQGESDALSATYAAAYETNLTNFIATIRGEFNVPEMPFIVGRVLSHFDTEPPSGAAMVRAAQETVANDVDDVFWFDTDSLSQRSDFPGHYDTQGQIDLGELFAEKNLAAIPEPSSMSLMLYGFLAAIVALGRRWK